MTRKLTFDLQSTNTEFKNIFKNFKETVKKTDFIKGENVFKFENSFKNTINSKFCISCNSGTDALVLILKSMNLKRTDEVITTSHSWISTSEAIVNAGANQFLLILEMILI